MEEQKALRSRILEMLYTGYSEDAILLEIIENAERTEKNSICSILTVDEHGKHLMSKAAPGLPEFYNQAINGFPIGEGQGSCGTSAFRGERVIVEDISIHPYWKNIKDLAKRANVRSCWSEPIKDPSGKVVGTFAIYHRTPNTPNEKELELIKELAEITAIVLDRHRIINQLKESENKFKTLASASNEAVFILEGDKIIEVNYRVEELFGYSEEELSGMSIFNFIEQEYWVSPLTDKSRNFRHKIKGIGISKRNKSIDVVVKIKNSKFKSKEVCLLSVRDVTNYKNARAEVLKLSQSVIQSPVSIVITNKEGIIEYVNPKFIELTGYSLEEIVGENPKILSSGFNSSKVYESLWETINSGKEWRGEFYNKKKNGKLFWERASISPIKDDDGNIINFLAVKEDITEQKRQDEVQEIILNISNAVLSDYTLVEFIQFIREELNKIIDTTNFFVALYDEESEYFHMPYHDDKFDSVDKFPKGKTISGWIIDNGKPLLATSHTLKKMADNGELALEGIPSKIWLGMPLRGNGKTIGVLVIQSYDDESAVTEEDQEVLELVSHQISISIEKKRIEDDLRVALHKAKESDRLKSVFLATMSHELRTPLNAIIGFSDLVDEYTSMDTAIDYCKMINQSGNHLLNIVEDLFDISLIESGVMQINREECVLNKLFEDIDEVIKVEQKLLGKEDLVLTLNIPKKFNDKKITTDPGRIKQIFLNLLKNALKFTDKGGVEYGLISLDDKDDQLYFFVKDSGIGIPEDQQDSVFNKFQQVNVETSKQHDGVGIGLSITKSLVEMLGGEISLESQLKLGTTFYFTHPY